MRLGNAAPELLDAYRAGEMGPQALQAFCVTADAARQRAVWEGLKAQHHGPGVWRIRRLPTEGRMPASSAVATFVGTAAYESAGGALTRDLFAEEDERGTWFDDPVLLRNLALAKLETVAGELRTKWAWAEAGVEVDWNDTARFARIRPKPGQAMAQDAREVQTLTARRDELTELDDDAWTGETESELGRIEARLDAIQQSVAGRAVFRRQDREIAGAIATVGDDGTPRLIQGLVRPEDIPAADPPGPDGASSNDAGNAASAARNGHDADEPRAHVQPPALSRPAPPQDPEAAARKRVGIGVGLADDVRAIRTSLIKGHLANDFPAAFDLFLFQIARRVFTPGYIPDALDITVAPTPERPPIRRNDTRFDGAARGEQLLERNRSALPLDWLAIDDDQEAFRALRDLPRAGKESLFASRVARTAEGAVGIRALGAARARSHGGSARRRLRLRVSAGRGTLLEPFDQGEAPRHRVPHAGPGLGRGPVEVQEGAARLVHGTGVRSRRPGRFACHGRRTRRGTQVDAAGLCSVRCRGRPSPHRHCRSGCRPGRPARRRSGRRTQR